MTAQIPDLLTFNDRQYVVLAWNGNTDCIPTSQDLGFEPVTQSTANWSGRIDHFGVWGDQLYLFKLDVTLDAPETYPTPANARREILYRYEQLYNLEGRPTELKEYRHDFFVYENLKIPFTGTVTVSSPGGESWDRPQAAPEEPDGAPFVIEFVDGRVTDVYDA